MKNLTKALKVLQSTIPIFFLMLIASHLDWFPLLYALYAGSFIPEIINVIIVLGFATFLRFMIYAGVSRMLFPEEGFWNSFKALSLLNATILAPPTVAIYMMMTYAIYGRVDFSPVHMIGRVEEVLLGLHPNAPVPGMPFLFVLAMLLIQLIMIETPKLLLYLYIAKRYIILRGSLRRGAQVDRI